VVAYDYPLLGIFWTMLIFFLWFAWIMLLFRIIVDIFRSSDLGGFSKAMWTLFVFILPLLGALVYLIARGDSMAKRDIATAQANEAAFRDYVRDAAGSGGGGGTASELAKLAELHSSGVLTDEEFAQQKAKLLA
jgi:hypothetical protein